MTQKNQYNTHRTEAYVREILDTYVKDRLSSTELAKRFGESAWFVQNILSGRKWRNVPRPEGFEYPWPENKLMVRGSGDSAAKAKTSQKEIEDNLYLFYQGKINKKDMAKNLGLSERRVRLIVAGKAWTMIDRQKIKKEAENKLEEVENEIEDVKRKLQFYADYRITVKDFAEVFDMGVDAARALLAGETYASVPRPEGFQFPWKISDGPRSRKFREERLKEFVQENLTAQEFKIRCLLKTYKKAIAILRGEDWTDIPRPEGFEYPKKPITDKNEQAKLLQRYVAERMTLIEFQKAARVNSTAHAKAILIAITWKDVPRPEGFMYPWPGNSHRKHNEKNKTNLKYNIPDEKIKEGLRLFYAKKLSLKELYALWNVPGPIAHNIIYGKTRRHIDREKIKAEVKPNSSRSSKPSRPSNKKSVVKDYAMLTVEQKTKLLQRYVDEAMSLPDFHRASGLPITSAHRVLKGLSWRDIPRPEGLIYPRYFIIKKGEKEEVGTSRS